MGEKKRYEEDSEFILKHIRYFALNSNILHNISIAASSIIYTSTKQNINLSNFYEYVLHRNYGLNYSNKPNLSDKDSYFVPSGYDSLPVLKGFDSNDDLNRVFDERIPPNKSKAFVKNYFKKL